MNNEVDLYLSDVVIYSSTITDGEVIAVKICCLS